MDFTIDDDQKALRELAAEILRGEATQERLREVEHGDERVDLGLWKQLAKANLLGVAIAEAHGGNGMGLSDLCVLLEEIGRTTAPLPAVETLVLGASAIERFGSAEQQQKWLPGVVSGDTLLSASLVEDAGAEVVATADGAGFRLSGRRLLVPNAHVASRVLLPARTDGGLSWFLVDPSGDGVSSTRKEVVNLQIHSDLELSEVPVDAADRLDGDAEAIRRFLADRARLAACAIQLGTAERALEMTAEYTRERKQFDRPVGSFQAVHTRAGDAYVDLQCMRLSYWRARFLVEQGADATDELEVAKYWAGEAGARVCYAAQHLHGGIGVDTDYPLHRHYLWGTHGTIAGGSPRELLESIGERIAG